MTGGGAAPGGGAPAGAGPVPGGMVTPGGMAPQGGASLRLPAEHFVAGIVFLVAGGAGLVWIAPELSRGLYQSPHVAGVTHFFTLGWLTTTIFGALYQLIQVALGASVRSERLGHIGFWFFVPGVAVFAPGVMTQSVVLHHAGLTGIGIGLACAIVNIAMSLKGAAIRDVVWYSVAVSMTYLCTTFILGIVLVHNIHTGFLGGGRVTTVAIHLHVAIIGWVLIMIAGVSRRLLPMFLLSHTVSPRLNAVSVAFLASGLAILAWGLTAALSSVAWAGLVLIEAGLAAFVVQGARNMRARKRPGLDAGLLHVRAALVVFVIAGLLAPFVLYGGAEHRGLATIYILTGLLGAIGVMVMGLQYKVVPFLAWVARYRGRVGRERVPVVAQLTSPRAGRVGLALALGGVALLDLGVIMVQPLVAYAGAALFFAATVNFMLQLRHAAWGTIA